MDCTETGAPPPTSTSPTWICLVMRRSCIAIQPTGGRRYERSARAQVRSGSAEDLADVEEHRRQAEREEDDEDERGHGNELAEVDPHLASPDLGRCLLVDDDRGVPPVEGQQRDEVEQSDDEVDGAEQEQQAPDVPADEVAADVDDPHDRTRALVRSRASLLRRVTGEVLAVALEAVGREQAPDAGTGVARHLTDRRERLGNGFDRVEGPVRRHALADRYADDPALVAAAPLLGNRRQCRRPAAPFDDDRRGLPDTVAQRFGDVAIDVEVLPVDADDSVAVTDARFCRRAIGEHARDRGFERVGKSATDERGVDEKEGEDQVHGHAGEDDCEPVAEGAVPERSGLLVRVDVFEVAHADDADVAAGGDGLHAILRLAPSERPHPRPEAEEVLRHLHARALGREVVTGLVEHDQRHDAEDDREGGDRRRAQDGEEDQAEQDEQEGDAGAAAGDVRAGFLEGVLHAALLRSTAVRARSRASRSASRTSATSSTFPVPRCITSSTTAAMPSHGIRPPRNASTATSLAALRVAGAPPPARPAAYARPRHGNASVSRMRQVGPAAYAR